MKDPKQVQKAHTKEMQKAIKLAKSQVYNRIILELKNNSFGKK